MLSNSVKGGQSSACLQNTPDLSQGLQRLVGWWQVAEKLRALNDVERFVVEWQALHDVASLESDGSGTFGWELGVCCECSGLLHHIFREVYADDAAFARVLGEASRDGSRTAADIEDAV